MIYLRTIIRKVAAFLLGTTTCDELNHLLQLGAVLLRVRGRGVNLTSWGRSGHRDNGEPAKWGGAGVRLDTLMRARDGTEKLTSLANRPQQPGAGRDHLVGLAAPKKAWRVRAKLAVSNLAVVGVRQPAPEFFPARALTADRRGTGPACPQPRRETAAEELKRVRSRAAQGQREGGRRSGSHRNMSWLGTWWRHAPHRCESLPESKGKRPHVAPELSASC